MGWEHLLPVCSMVAWLLQPSPWEEELEGWRLLQATILLLCQVGRYSRERLLTCLFYNSSLLTFCLFCTFLLMGLALQTSLFGFSLSAGDWCSHMAACHAFFLLGSSTDYILPFSVLPSFTFPLTLPCVSAPAVAHPLCYLHFISLCLQVLQKRRKMSWLFWLSLLSLPCVFLFLTRLLLIHFYL